MLFMIMHKANANDEAGVLPTKELIDMVGTMVGEMAKAGILRGGDGLRPSSEGVRLQFSKGKRIATPGPFVGGNELPQGFAIVQVKSIDDAVEWATRLASAVGDAEFDVRPMSEPWHLGMARKPAGLTTTRYMIAHKADANSEAGIPPGVGKVLGEMKAAGVLQSSAGLEPSRDAVRMKYARGKAPILTDGPFAESKELIGGFVILEVPSRAEAIRWSDPYGKALGDVEMDVRAVRELS